MDFVATLRKRTRAARLARFTRYLDRIQPGVARPLEIIDLGGTANFWNHWWGVNAGTRLHVTLINNHAFDRPHGAVHAANALITDVNRDARTLTEDDFRKFDLVFSNSMLEHLGSRAAQSGLAETIFRSGVPYFIQVPNKYSPIDPHHPFAPFFAIYPYAVRIRLLTFSTFGNGTRCRTLDDAQRWQNWYCPLGMRDMRRMFPDAELQVERPFGVPMSIIASKRPDNSPPLP